MKIQVGGQLLAGWPTSNDKQLIFFLSYTNTKLGFTRATVYNEIQHGIQYGCQGGCAVVAKVSCREAQENRDAFVVAH